VLVIIDNYDSFTYNLVQYFEALNREVQVFRNDAITVQEINRLSPSHVVISPGPGDPSEAGVSNAVILELGREIPTLGVCLGHQCIASAFGGKIEQAKRLMHGKTSLVYHHGCKLFRDIPSPFVVTRYHSLIVADPLPPALSITAHTQKGEIMALRHVHYPIYGVQFHPESILTEHGMQILRNFINYA
jgi:anthranilate synthase/aminodeoxychorismate synthase-like glutamine amidotransferase